MRNVGLAMALTIVIPAFGAWLFVALIQLIVDMKKIAKSQSSQELRAASSSLIAVMIVGSICIGISISGIYGALNEYITILQKSSWPLNWQSIIYGSLLLASILVIVGGITCSICLLASWKKVRSLFQAIPEINIKEKGISACKTMKIAQSFTIVAMGLGSYIPIMVAVIWDIPNLSQTITRYLNFALIPICLGAVCMGLLSIGLQLRSYFTAGSALQETGNLNVRTAMNAGQVLVQQISPFQPALYQSNPLQPISNQSSTLQRSPLQESPLQPSPQQEPQPWVPVQQLPMTAAQAESPIEIPLIIDDISHNDTASISKKIECPFCGNTFIDDDFKGTKEAIHICPQCGNSIRS